jgi:eukaryotic-like serine/threonine-protein kinase
VKHPRLGRQAMKVFKTQPPQTEALLLTRLTHPHIIRLYETGKIPTTAGTKAFLTMEYVPGGTLYRHWAQPRPAPLPKKRTVRTLRQIADGLATAHARQPPILHLDITPHNILIDESGHARLGDFGLAKIANPATPRAPVTIAYAPPESVLGAQAETCATDIWAMGVIAYLMLTDTYPYHDGASKRATPPRPSALNSDVDSQLDEIVLDALAPNPVRRTPNAVVLARQLAEYEGAVL